MATNLGVGGGNMPRVKLNVSLKIEEFSKVFYNEI